jgi:adenosine kinase
MRLLAYDTIMVFPDQFKKHILPDKIHVLNVAFMVPDMRLRVRRDRGQHRYNLRLLGEDPLIMATVGHDFKPYAKRLQSLGLATTHVRMLDGQFTAQAFITTDIDDNQITAFHPGAMSDTQVNHISDAKGITLAIVSPSGRQGMIEHTRDLAASGIPFVFDPGQGLPMFSGDDLLAMLRGARALTVNDYEAHAIEEKTGRRIEDIAATIGAVIVTRGGEGSTIYTQGREIGVPAVSPTPWSTRPVAATPTARACSTAWRAAGTGSAARSSPP